MANRNLVPIIFILMAMSAVALGAQQPIKGRYAKEDDKRLDNSRSFFMKNKFLRDDYLFSDNENRKLILFFLNSDTLVIINSAKNIKEDAGSIDMYSYHYSGHRSMIIDSVLFIMRNDTTFRNGKDFFHPFKCNEKVAKPGSCEMQVNCANQAFYILEPGEEILMSKGLDRLQVRDFTFIIQSKLVDDIFSLYILDRIAPVTPADTVTRRHPIVR